MTDIFKRALEEALEEVRRGQSAGGSSVVLTEADGSAVAQPLPGADPLDIGSDVTDTVEEVKVEKPAESAAGAPIDVDETHSSEADLFVPSPDSMSEIDNFKFVNLLNQFRASPSFSEGEPRVELDSLWESLEPRERYFLYVAMLGVTQVTLKGAQAVNVSHPHDFGLRIGSQPGDSASSDEDIRAGALPADRIDAALPADQFAPIVVGESLGRRKKFLQGNARKLQDLR